MSDSGIQPKAGSFPTMPSVNAVSFGDLRDSLLQGFSDFGRAPLVGLFFAAIFVAIGLAVVLSLTAWHTPWLIYPFAIGFPLVGPFAAVGFYEVSRELEQGRKPSWPGVFSVIWQQRRREIGWMAFVLLFFFWVWMYQVRILMALFLGRLSFSSFDGFVSVTFTTTEGLIFMFVGHVVGAALALLLFSITVISMPLLLERDIDIVTAMITSIKVVATSPIVMLVWGVAVTLAVIVGSLPLFLGLLIVLPVLGHTTWHIYRKAVVPAANQNRSI